MPQSHKGRGRAQSAALIGVIVAGMSAAAPARAHRPDRPQPLDRVAIETFLRAALARPDEPVDPGTRYTAVQARLGEGASKDILVYVEGGSWCGSGGCRLLILAPDAEGYRLVARTTLTRPPIRLLNTRTHGWRDIGVTVSGGGIMRPYEAVLSFDGVRYPSNPTVPPARALPPGMTRGVVVIGSDAAARPLYPR